MTSITIDEEFRALIAPLKIDELGLLEAAIVEADGATDPLKTWNGLLLDGHHRFKICERLGLPYTTVEVEGIEDREQALRWIETNQLGRRNLSLDQRATIALRVMQRETALAMKERAKAAAEARWNASCLEDDATSKHPPGPTTMAAEPEAASAVVQQMQIPAAEVRQAAPKQRTRAAVALQQGIPERMLRSVAEIEKKDPPAIDRIVRGETTLVQERAKLNAAARAAIAANPPVLPTGKYSVIVVDPPWDMKKIDRDVRPNQVGFDYPTMSNDELIELPVDEWAYDDCHLFLWTTHRFPPNAFELLKHWGFRYVDTWVWMKPGGFQPIGLPQYNCEFALLARRGKPIFVELTDFKLCFEAIGFKADRHQHSRKPDEFYNLVRRVTVGRRIDVFSREPREGFEQHGNEIDKFSSSETASSPAVGGAAVIRATLRMPGEAAGDQHDDAALCEPEPAVASVGAPSGEVRNV